MTTSDSPNLGGIASASIVSDSSIKDDIAALSWFTPALGTMMGYGVAAVGLIRGLMDNECFVGYNNPHPKVHVSFVQPEWYLGVEGQFKVGYTPWESTVIPDTWKYYMQQQDQIWTTSKFCVDVFESFDVHDDIRLVPHGIDPEVWTVSERTLSDKFIFLHVGGTSERKGAQKVVDTFLDLYDGDESKQLVLKSNGVSEARWRRGDFYGGNIANHPQVTVITADLEVGDLVRLYHQAHCLVYPTNGEGFGFIPFQGIATGMPTIATNLTATADFAELSMPLDATWTDGFGLHLGQWAEPDLEHLHFLMKDVVDNWELHKKKAMHSARIIHSTQTWNHIGQLVMDILGDRLYERI